MAIYKNKKNNCLTNNKEKIIQRYQSYEKFLEIKYKKNIFIETFLKFSFHRKIV